MAREEKKEQERTGQDRAGQDRTGQGRACRAVPFGAAVCTAVDPPVR